MKTYDKDSISNETIELLEVGEQTKNKYLEQSKKASQEFLLKGINLANDCDLKYKTSKNQRLLVELTLMQLASITYDGEKKNSRHFIIPPSYFKAKGITPIPISKPDTINQKQQTENNQAPQKTINVPVNVKEVAAPSVPKLSINKPTKVTSGLSLKSIREKKEHQINKEMLFK